MVEEIRNENEFRIFAMRRSGHHAIVNWIAGMCDEPVYYFNGCRLGVNPFDGSRISRGDHNEALRKLYRQTKRQLEVELRPIKKKYLMYDYEDKRFTDYEKYGIVEHKDLLIGKSRNEYEILITRDVFNWIASLIIMRGIGRKTLAEENDLGDNHKFGHQIWGGGYRKVFKRLQTWGEYAKELLNETNYLKHNKICIFFDKWVTDVDYRKSIASHLNLNYNEDMIKYVGAIADDGSSFDGVDYDGKAQDMDVLNRWKVFENNPIYWGILKYKKWKYLIELNTKIYKYLNIPISEECIEKAISQL